MTALEHQVNTSPLAAAEAAAASAGVHMRTITELADHDAAVALLSGIWGRSGNPPVTTELLHVLSKAGHYVGAAFAGTRIVGATIAFHEAPDRHILHSHIAGVDPAVAGQGVGYAMKLHQRAWAVERGIDIIEWTFDPLVARNAYFNICKLGAMPNEYLINFYGILVDSLNGDDESDRLLVRWKLGPQPTTLPIDQSTLSAVAVPEDIEYLRRHDPTRAHAWRRTVRDNLGELMRTGGRVVGFDGERGYLIQTTKELN